MIVFNCKHFGVLHVSSVTLTSYVRLGQENSEYMYNIVQVFITYSLIKICFNFISMATTNAFEEMLQIKA